MRRFAHRRTHKPNAAAAAAASAAVSGEPVPSTSQVRLEDYALQPKHDSKPKKRAPGTIKMPAAIAQPVALSLGRNKQYTQLPNLPASIHPGVPAWNALWSGPGEQPRTALQLDAHTRALVQPHGWLSPGSMFGDDEGPSMHHARRAAQHATWRQDVLPRLVPAMLRVSHGLPVEVTPEELCFCGRARACTIVLADWDDVRSQQLRVCQCRPAAEQLIAQGFFPCAPRRPTVAFSLRLLEFLALHDLHVAPNVRAWASTLRLFWMRRGHISNEKLDFRKRLGNALRWYQVLVNMKDASVLAAINGSAPLKRRADEEVEGAAQAAKRARRHTRGQTAVQTDGEDAQQTEEEDAPQAEAEQGDSQPQADGDEQKEEEVPKETSGPQADGARTRPSALLRSRCPMCFGGDKPILEHTGAHVIVCLDANFSQKRRKSSQTDPAVSFAGSRFVPPSEVDNMEHEVDEKRKKPTKRRRRGKAAKLSDDILDECQESFTAAQESVTKASKNYYAETGLMALLCRHDRVLFLVNLTTPGERQHNALALLRRLMLELPPDWHVGVLYDIACQLSRSVEKYDFLAEFADRLMWAVSVFHAYGHQWACQLIFHPRKCDGFGLADGEGCERFWSAIRRLIAVLRVTGYHQRLFVLDRQIDFNDTESLSKSGSWLARRHRECSRRLREALDALHACGVSEEDLSKEWDAQISAQIVKPTRQSQNAGDKLVNDIVLDIARAEEVRDELKDARGRVRRQAHRLAPREVQVLTDRVDAATQQLSTLTARIKEKSSRLGTGDARRLESLRGDAYIRARVNARALRANIRLAIVAHKFERERLERAYRNQVMQNKDHVQAKDLVHRREKNVSAMVRKYNVLVNQMEVLVATRKVPKRGTRAPRRLDTRKLFRLDVDDEIWQEDPGLGPQDEHDLPRWQVDHNVRSGIPALLEARRCREELERLGAEAKALAAWWREERQVLALFSTRDDAMQREVQERLRRLDAVAGKWSCDLENCALAGTFETAPAGPSTAHQGGPGTLAATQTREEALEYNSDDDSILLDSEDDGDDAVADLLDTDPRMFADDDDEEGPGDEDGNIGARNDNGAITTTEDALAASPGASVAPSAAERVQGNAGSQPRSPAAEGTRPAVVQVVTVIPDTSDSEDDEEEMEGAVVAVHRAELPRRCGDVHCEGEDVARIASRTRWFSGDGLAVFAQSHLDELKNPRVGHVDATVCRDVKCYLEGVEEDDEMKRVANKEWVAKKLRKAPSPQESDKWLVVVHVEVPRHWTLVEVRWNERKLMFYDSFSATQGYAVVVRRQVTALLSICEDVFKCDLEVPKWEWVGEQRMTRQSNSYDCGAFVAADLVSLLRSDSPSGKTQKEMGRWRTEMAERLRALPEDRVKSAATRGEVKDRAQRASDVITVDG